MHELLNVPVTPFCSLSGRYLLVVRPQEIGSIMCIFCRINPHGAIFLLPTVRSFSMHSSVSCTARPPPSILQRTTIQRISISSKKDNLTEEPRNRAEPPPPPIRHSPSTPTSSPPVPSPVSPPSQPSLLASLLARKRSIVTVPATKEVSPPSRGSSCLSPDRLPYLPHSPFHLFSYDLDEEPSKSVGESPKETSPRSDRQCNSKPRSSPRFSGLFSLSTSFSALFLAPAQIRFHHLLVVTSSLLTSSFQFFDFTPSACQRSCYHLLFLHMSFSLISFNAWIPRTCSGVLTLFFPSHGFSLLDVVFSPLPFSIFTCIPVEDLLVL